jgi:hypothetical protein
VGARGHGQSGADAQGLVLAEVAVGHPAALALHDDLDAIACLAAGDEDLARGRDLADLDGVVAGLRPEVEVGGRPELGLGLADSARGGGQGAVGAGLLHGVLLVPLAGGRPGHDETIGHVGRGRQRGRQRTRPGARRDEIAGDGAGAEDADRDDRGGRQDGKSRGELVRGREPAEETAGIGVPLVAMICHSADPLLLDVRGNGPLPEGVS